MLLARSHFTAVKYLRKAYLVGGGWGKHLETIDLDTGESLVLFQGSVFDYAKDWAGLISGDSLILSGWYDNIVLLHLPTTFRYFLEPRLGWIPRPKKYWILGENIRVLSPKCTWTLWLIK